MSYETDRYSLARVSNQSLCIVECGIQTCHPGHTSPKLTYKNYSAHFILEGKGVYILDEKSYELNAGQGFMITPGANCIYIADKKHPWKYVYVSFAGIDDKVLVHNAGLDEENVIFSFSLDEAMIKDIYAMHEAGKINAAKGYDATGYFLLCMSRLVKANLSNSELPSLSETYVKKACVFVEEHYSDKIFVSDIANHIGLDRTYLYRIFKSEKNCSPSEYLINYRLEKAAELLRERTVPISEIGVSVGFCDTYHFYKSFTAKYKTTPKKYMMNHEEN